MADKTAVRRWDKPTSQGQLFSFTLLDESAAIRATVFNDAVDTFEPLLVNGQVYYFSGGQVKDANRQFSNVNNAYELTFNRSSEIILARQDATTSALPMKRYNFIPIELLKQREPGSLVDVLGVVLSVGEISSVTQRSTGRELVKRDVKVGDMTASVSVTVWNDEAKAWTCPAGTVLALRQLKVGTYDGVTLSSTYQTKVDISPTDIPDVSKLSNWYISTGGSNVASLSVQGGAAGGGAGGETYRGRKFIDEISAEGLGRGAKPDFVDLRCVPIYLKQDAQWYDACPTCNKKVTIDGAKGDRYRCEKCDAAVEPKQRYLISIQVTDNVSQVWLTLFNEAGVEFFGMEASELKKRAEEDPMYVAKLAQGRMNRPVLMRIRVKEEPNPNAMMADDADRLRMSVVRLSEFMPIGGTSEETRHRLAQNLRAECDDILKSIEAYV